MGKQEAAAEDMAIQDTLTMSAQERIELLANLIADKIADDQNKDQLLSASLAGVQNAN